MQPKTIPECVSYSADNHLRLCVFAANGSHVPAALLWRVYVGHDLPITVLLLPPIRIAPRWTWMQCETGSVSCTLDALTTRFPA